MKVSNGQSVTPETRTNSPTVQWKLVGLVTKRNLPGRDLFYTTGVVTRQISYCPLE